MSRKDVLTPLQEKYFSQWIESSTWFKNNHGDRLKFFLFVKSCVRYFNRYKNWKQSGDDVRDLVLERKATEFSDEHRKFLAQRYADMFNICAEYHEARPFPAPAIECKDYNELNTLVAKLKAAQ